MSSEQGSQLNNQDTLTTGISEQLEENLRWLGLDEIDESQKRSYRYRKAHGEDFSYHGKPHTDEYDYYGKKHRSHSHSSSSSHSHSHSSGSSHSRSQSEGSAHSYSEGRSRRSTYSRTSSADHRQYSAAEADAHRHDTEGGSSRAAEVRRPTRADALENAEKNRARLKKNAIKSKGRDRSEKRKEQKNLSRRERRYEKRLRKQRRRRAKDRKPLPLRILLGILIAIAVLLVAAIVTLLVLRYIGKKNLKDPLTDQKIRGPEDAIIEDDGRVIKYKGHTYVFNDNIVGILFLGVDRDLSDKSDREIGEGGQADTLVLGALDTSTGHMELVNISRDTVTDIEIYNRKGKYAGTKQEQICLAYSYGDGEDGSCKNTAKAVSNLFYGMPIHEYAAVDYSQIAALNDAVGGVTVKVLEDLSDKDPELKKDETVHLKGQQAHTYVRSRRTEKLKSNNSRMDRQMQYMYAYLQKAREETKHDRLFPVKLYRHVRDNTVMSIKIPEITYMGTKFVMTGFSRGDIKTIPGKIREVDGYAALKPNERKLFETVLDTYYTRQD